MSTEENVQIVKNFIAAIGSGEKQVLLSLVAEDIESGPFQAETGLWPARTAIEFSYFYISNEGSLKPPCDRFDSQLFEEGYLANKSSVLVPADVAAIVDSSQQETLRVLKLW